MRKISLGLAIAACVLASPALAGDGESYFGFGAGMIMPDDSEYTLDITGREVVPEMDNGWEGELLLGHDFGMFRLEAEAAYKDFGVDSLFAPAVGIQGATNALATGTFDPVDGDVKIMTSMLNALLDIGGNDGIGFAVGLGAGIAGVDTEITRNAAGPGFLDSEGTAFAWQGIAQLRVPVSDSIDFGLKYRYFRTNRLDFGDAETTVVQGNPDLLNLGTTASPVFVERRTSVALDTQFNERFRSHSLLASLIFNFGGRDVAPPPPPPPPPPAPVEVAPPPQTQTCPDGSVVLATDVCPVPPGPPPPPPVEPVRG